jgi:exosortase J
MIFAPNFGILIVPGCNGVRGSVTFAYLTLFFGYAQGLRPRVLALLTLSAFLLGYALNLLRLCMLVLYYRAGVAYPAIQNYGMQMDYAIGCAIFLFATLLLGYLIRSVEPRGSQLPVVRSPLELSSGRTATLARGTLFAVLICACLVRDRQMLASALPLWPDSQKLLKLFPTTVGDYQLQRTYTEQLGNGVVGFVMADYAAPAKADQQHRLTLGLWVASGPHSVALSKSIQGARPRATGRFDALDRRALPIRFNLALYDDGVSQEFDADALCYRSSCSHADTPSPRTAELVFAPIGRHLPIVLLRELTSSIPGSQQTQLQMQFEADSRDFAAHLDLSRLIELAGTQP